MSSASAHLGYEERRDDLEQFVDEHYISRFDLQPSTLLDAGCGDGFWTDIFARRGFLAYGVDRDSAAISSARARCMRAFAANEYEPGLLPTFRVADLTDLGRQGFAPKLIFARTLPQFYGPDLLAATSLLTCLRRRLAHRGEILLSVYTDESDTTDISGATHHTCAQLTSAAALAEFKLRDLERAQGYLQLLLEPTP